MERNRLLAFMVAAAIVATGASLWALGEDQKQVQIPVPRVLGYDGAALYNAYCASCHGPIGKGNGPIAGQLNNKVPDLTAMTDQTGKFDTTHVVYHIVSPTRSADEVMPNWRRYLKINYSMNESAAFVAAHNLAGYIATLQTNTVPANNRRH